MPGRPGRNSADAFEACQARPQPIPECLCHRHRGEWRGHRTSEKTIIFTPPSLRKHSHFSALGDRGRQTGWVAVCLLDVWVLFSDKLQNDTSHLISCRLGASHSEKTWWKQEESFDSSLKAWKRENLLPLCSCINILWIFCSQSCWKKDCFCFSKLSTVLAGPLMSVLAHFSWWFSWYTTTNWQISYRTCYLSCKLLGNPTTPGCLCHTVSDLIGVIIFVTCAFTLWYSGFCCFSHKAILPNIHCCRWKETRSHSAPNG